MTERETSADIESQAALWAARIDSAPTDERASHDLAAWLNGDTRRIGAYAMARATLARLDVAGALGADYDPERICTEASGRPGTATATPDAQPLPSETGAVPQQEVRDAPPVSDADTHAALSDPAPPLSRRGMLRLSGAAAAAAAIGAVGIGLWGSGQRYSTSVGQLLRIPLPDGSVVNLNTASSLDVQFSPERRTIVLRGGEALFDVAKDPARPFVVIAGETHVQAVGTSFTVRREDTAAVAVVVNEGVVEVSQKDMDVPPVRLEQNMEALADSRAVVPIAATSVPPEAVARQLFWKDGKLGFSDTTLAEAAAEFARYSDERIVIPDPTVAEQRITGLFSATNPEGFADTVALSFGLRVHRADRIITLTEG